MTRRNRALGAGLAAVLVLGACSLLPGRSNAADALTEQLEALDIVTSATVLERREEGLGEEYLDLTCTFAPGLDTAALAGAVDEVYRIADAQEIPMTRHRLVFDDARSYVSEKPRLDSGNGILETVAPLDNYEMSLREHPKDSGIQVIHEVKVTSDAANLDDFTPEVDEVLDVMATVQQRGLYAQISVEAPGEGFQKAGNYNFATVEPLDEQARSLVTAVLAIRSPGLVGLSISKLDRNMPKVRAFTNGPDRQVAENLSAIVRQYGSPEQPVAADAVAVGNSRPWFEATG